MNELITTTYEEERSKKLERFFKEVAEITINHEVIVNHAHVSPRDLGDALSRVDPDWYKKVD